jgi:hypothetical protein
MLDCLKVFDNHFVVNALHLVHSSVQESVLGYESSYKQHGKQYEFDEADKKLALLRAIHDDLPTMQIKVNLIELLNCNAKTKQKLISEILRKRTVAAFKVTMCTAAMALGTDLTGLGESPVLFYNLF